MEGKEHDEIKKLLQQNTKIAEENNKLLKKINSRMAWGSFFRLVYWLIVIGAAVGAYYYLQPIIDALRGNFDQLLSIFNQVQDITSLLPQ